MNGDKKKKKKKSRRVQSEYSINKRTSQKLHRYDIILFHQAQPQPNNLEIEEPQLENPNTPLHYKLLYIKPPQHPIKTPQQAHKLKNTYRIIIAKDIKMHTHKHNKNPQMNPSQDRREIPESLVGKNPKP